MSSIESDGFKSYLDSMSREEKLVRKAAFFTILDQKAATIEDIVSRSGLDLTTAANTTKKLLEAGLVVGDESGAIVGSWGLTLTPTNHHLVISGKDYYTWCAEDIVGIPAALELNATVHSECYRCGDPVTIEMKKGEVLTASSPAIHIWIAEREIGLPTRDSF